MTGAPPVEMGQVAAWFHALYRGCDGYLSIVSTGNWAGRAYPVEDGIAAALRHVQHLGHTGTPGIYARVTTLREPPDTAGGRRGGADLTASLPLLWADLDIAGPGHKHTVCAGGEACTHLAEGIGHRLHARAVLPLPPNAAAARAIVEISGLPDPSLWVHSGGGLYPLWRLDPVHRVTDDLAGVAALAAGWQDVIVAAAARAGYHYGAGVGDLARVLRIPGTWNAKPALPEPVACRVLEESDRRYTLEDLHDALVQARTLLPAPVPPPAVARRPVTDRPAGDVRPGDDFTARVDWTDPLLLGGLGWTVASALPDGERRWLRLGATSDRTASTGRGGLDNLWVFSTETPFPTEQVISKFEAFRIIHGYATHKDATRALNRLGFGSAAVRQAPDVAPARGGLPDDLTWPGGATVGRPDPPSPNGAQRPTQPAVQRPELDGPDGRTDTAGPPDSEPFDDPPNNTEPPSDLRPEGFRTVSGPDSEPDPDDVGQPDGDEEDEEEVDTWEPIDLGPYLRGEIKRAEPSLGVRRSDGVRLIYPGKEHAVIGEMEAGKGWFALVCAVEEMRAGRRVLYIHFEEADPLDTVERLRTLGCTNELVLTYFAFVGPSKAIKPKQRRRLARMGAALVVLDGVNEGMSLHKADIRDENGAAEFRRIMVKPFTARGAAVISLDHVVKDRETRDRYALGSIHKGNALDGALIVLETQDAFGRNQRGRSSVFVGKDRPGFLRQHGRPTKLPGKTYMGEFVVDDRREAGASMSVTFYAPANLNAEDIQLEPLPSDETDDERVLAAIHVLISKSMSTTCNLIRAEAGMKTARVREALDRLTVDGRIVEIPGPNRARMAVPADDPRLQGETL
jgi:hypothetical protein